jgi:RNA polymerase sigma-70 factor (ECF subfamily)
MNRTNRGTPVDEIQHVRSAVRGVLRRLVGAEDPEYEDLVQSSIENVLVSFERGRFRGDCPQGGWAAVIARNVAIDAIRARIRERQLFAHDEADLIAADNVRGADAKTGPEHLTGVQERLHRVKSAMLGLGAQKANVIFLHDVLGHELPDVAGILKITVAAAQSRLVRGRREIIERIDASPGTRRGTDAAPAPPRGAAAPPGTTGMKMTLKTVVTGARRAHPPAGTKQLRKRPFPMLS